MLNLINFKWGLLMKRYDTISEEYQTWSDAEKEAFLEDDRKDARLYTVFFSLFAGFAMLGLHSLIVGTDLYPSQDINAFLFTFSLFSGRIITAPFVVILLLCTQCHYNTLGASFTIKKSPKIPSINTFQTTRLEKRGDSRTFET